MNKLFIMAPLALAVRKIDSEDPQQVYILRVVYGVVQALCVIIVAYTFIQASSMSGKGETIYVAPPAQVSLILFSIDLETRRTDVSVMHCANCLHPWSRTCSITPAIR